MIPPAYIALAVMTAAIAGFVAGVSYQTGRHQAQADKAALSASQEATDRANKTTDIISNLVLLPDLADTDTVADRLRDIAPCSDRVPAPAERPRPARPAPAPAPAIDPRRLAGEIRQCVALADRYDALRAVWKNNEAH